MLYGLLVFVYVIVTLFIILVIMLQKGRGGIGSLGGAQASQVLFGGAGGQEVLERVTWIVGTVVMILALLLSIMKARNVGMTRYLTETPELVEPAPEAPTPDVSLPLEPVAPSTPAA